MDSRVHVHADYRGITVGKRYHWRSCLWLHQPQVEVAVYWDKIFQSFMFAFAD
jgi:hypothetical protein